MLGGAVHDSICPSLMLSEIYNTLSGAAQICADPLIFRFSGPLHRHYNHPRGKLHVTLLTPGHSHTHGHMQLVLPPLYDILSIFKIWSSFSIFMLRVKAIYIHYLARLTWYISWILIHDVGFIKITINIIRFGNKTLQNSKKGLVLGVCDVSYHR